MKPDGNQGAGLGTPGVPLLPTFPFIQVLSRETLSPPSAPAWTHFPYKHEKDRHRLV